MYLLPLVSTLFSGIFSGSMFARFYGHRGAGIINVFCLFVAFLSSLFMWYEVVFASSEVFIDLFNVWFTVGSFNVYWALYFDLTTVHLLLTVTSVSFAVHCYALVYMKSDPHLNLFMCYLSLFTFFMCVLVTGQDLIVMLVGWEGITDQCLNGVNITSSGDFLFCRFEGFLNKIEAFILDMPRWGMSAGILPPCPGPQRGPGQGGSMSASFFNKIRSAVKIGNYKRYRIFANGEAFKGTKRFFYKPRLPAINRRGSHTSLFKQILTGFLLGDGWLELHGAGARIGILITDKFEDVAAWYNLLFFILGYTDAYILSNPLKRTARVNNKSYYRIRTFSFSSLNSYYYTWYFKQENGKFVKVVPKDLHHTLTPLSLAIWLMSDGNGMLDGGFKIATHGFTKEDSKYLCDLLLELYGIEANVIRDGNNRHCIRVLKRSITRLYWLVKPFLLPSCEYKFRFVKQTDNS